MRSVRATRCCCAANLYTAFIAIAKAKLHHFSRTVCRSILFIVKKRPAAVFLSLALDWFIKEKRRNLYRLPSYHQRLLALPNRSRTATQKPTLVYATMAFGYTFPKALCRMHDITYPRASTVAQPLTSIWNFARISDGQESARINAFLLCSLHPTSLYPRPGLLLLRSATAKLLNDFCMTRGYVVKHINKRNI